MNKLAEHAQQYLRLRNALGHQLAEATRLLPRFVEYMDGIGATTITVEAALGWVQRPDADPTSSVWFRRMAVVRGFARHMSGLDPATEIPPFGLVTFRARWRPPFIYSAEDIQALMTEVPRHIPTPLRAATYASIIGLLSATGMRVGEAIHLQRSDIDWNDGVLIVRSSKFDKSRELPLHPSTTDALAAYAAVRDRHVPRPRTGAFFLSMTGNPVIYNDFGTIFRELLSGSGVGANSSKRPRIHDIRHSFAVHTLVRWYRVGDDVAALLPRLSTYLGHVSPGYTYWYLSAAPELLALAAGRLETAQEARR